MKDIIGREIKAGDYIAYGLVAGRSASLAVYQVIEVCESCLKACKKIESYGWGTYLMTVGDKKIPSRYVKRLGYDHQTLKYEYAEMTQTEKDKIDSKITSISMGERAFILNDFTPDLLG